MPFSYYFMERNIDCPFNLTFTIIALTVSLSKPPNHLREGDPLVTHSNLFHRRSKKIHSKLLQSLP